MTVLLNTGKMKPIRKELRHNQTEAETKLWQQLKGKQLDGLRFCRQFSIGRYVLDFYCPVKRLCVELDGGHHADSETVCYDKERTEYLNHLRVNVLRFWNNEVFENLDGVLEAIRRAAQDQASAIASEPSLLLKRGQGELDDL